MKTTITTIIVRSYSYERYLGGRLHTITTCELLLVITFRLKLKLCTPYTLYLGWKQVNLFLKKKLEM